MKKVKEFIATANLQQLTKASELITEAIKAEEEKAKNKAEVLQLLSEKGLSIDDLVTNDKRSKVSVKYRMEKDGEIFEWSGRGKRPKAFVGVDLALYEI